MNNPLPYAKKSLGQHWLSDAASLDAMCDAADVQPGDTVLEIGPGSGTLTAKLLERGAYVTAVEFDKQLATDLAGNISHHNLANNGVEPWQDRLIVSQADILRFDLRSLPAGYKLVANIPYYLTSNLLRVISESSNPPKLAALLVQKEVAERVAALPGDMSILSVSVQFYWSVKLGREVPARLFVPPPKVDSQILILNRHPEPLFTDVDVKDYFRLVKAGFSGKRKTLRNSLSAGLQIEKSETEEFLNKAGIDPQRRPETLSLKEWYSLDLTIQAGH